MNRRPAWLSGLLYLLAVSLAVIAVGPCLWLFAVALSPTDVPINRLPTPNDLTLANFRGVWGEASLGTGAVELGVGDGQPGRAERAAGGTGGLPVGADEVPGPVVDLRADPLDTDGARAGHRGAAVPDGGVDGTVRHA